MWTKSRQSEIVLQIDSSVWRKAAENNLTVQYNKRMQHLTCILIDYHNYCNTLRSDVPADTSNCGKQYYWLVILQFFYFLKC